MHAVDDGLEDVRPIGWILPCILAWLVPGAGHFFVGKRIKGVVFAVLIVSMFFLGLALDGNIYSVVPRNKLSYLSTPANMGIGLLYFVAKKTGWGKGDVISVTFEHGNAFILTASLMNILLILDTADISRGKKT